MVKMDMDLAIKNIVSKILYKNRKRECAECYQIYNKNVEEFLNRSCDAKKLNLGKAWIVEKPEALQEKAKKWVNMVEAEIRFNLSKGLTN